jgi:hypothetical protein
MENRKINQKDIEKIVKKVINEGSSWEGVKGWFRGKGYNYSKYLSEINDLLYGIKKKTIQDENLKQKIDEITSNVSKSSADDWQKDDLVNLMKELSDTITKTNSKLEKLTNRIKRMR